MSNKIEVINQALIAIGGNRISSLDDDTTESDVMNAIYEPVKRSVLRSYPWNCATKRRTLALKATAPENEFAYKYALPSDSLRVLSVYTGDYLAARADSDYTNYVIEGKELLAHDTGIIIKYIANIVEPEMDAHVEMALVAKLAQEASYPIQGSASNQAQLLQMAELKLNEARTTDNLEGGEQVFTTTRLQNVRY